MSTFFKHSYGKKTELETQNGKDKPAKKRKKKAKEEFEQLEATVERTTEVLRSVLGSWLDITLDEDLKLTTPEYVSGSIPAGAKGLVWNQSLPWEPAVEDLGDSVLVPPIPMNSNFRNKLVDDNRSQPIWLTGGEIDTTMNWQVGEEFAAPTVDQIRTLQFSGPGGLKFELAQNWDAQQRVFSTDVSLRRPFLLRASDYPAVKQFFVDVQRAVEQPILFKRQ
jgi:hypothetical protein